MISIKAFCFNHLFIRQSHKTLIAVLGGASSVSIAWTVAMYVGGGTGHLPALLLLAPVLVVSFYFGMLPGIIAAVVAGLLVGPSMPFSPSVLQNDVFWILRLLFFVMAAGLVGFLSSAVHTENIRLAEISASLQEALKEQAEGKISVQRANELLLQANESLQGMIQASPLPVIYVDRMLTIRVWNKAAENMFGWSSEDVLGRPLPRIPDGMQDDFERRMQRAFQGEVVSGVESHRHGKDGSLINIGLWTSPLKDTQGKIIGIMCILADLTQRKQAEQALAARVREQHMIAELGQYAFAQPDLQRLFDHAMAVVAETLNVEFCGVFALTPSGKEVLLRAGVGWDKDQIGQFTVSTGLEYQTGYTLMSFTPVIVEDFRRETRFSVHPLLLERSIISGMSCIIGGAGGRHWGVLEVHTPKARRFTPDDVHFLQAVANILASAIQRSQVEQALRNADSQKNDFLAMLSHELRNPLAALRSAADLMQYKELDDPDLQWMSGVFDHQIENLTHLVNDLLDVSHTMQGKITLRKEQVDLATVVVQATEGEQSDIDSRGQHLHVSLPREPISLNGDVTRLVQVVGNLLNNASKYTGDGGQVWLTADARDEEVLIRVRDTGIGIPPEVLPHVFDLYARGLDTSVRSKRGMGVGLTVVKSLVEMHGGRVQATSPGPGKGSEFRVYLPRLREPLSPKQREPVRAREGSTVPLRVLIIDDNEIGATSLARLLQLYGHETVIAPDGQRGLDAVPVFQPHVVLLDIGLPGMDGYEVARRLRQIPEGKHVNLIAVTGYGFEEDRKLSLEAGFNEHLLKPVEEETLMKVVGASTTAE